MLYFWHFKKIKGPPKWSKVDATLVKDPQLPPNYLQQQSFSTTNPNHPIPWVSFPSPLTMKVMASLSNWVDTCTHSTTNTDYRYEQSWTTTSRWYKSCTLYTGTHALYKCGQWTGTSWHSSWAPSQYKHCLSQALGIPMLKIRRSWDRLIFNMAIPMLVRRYLYIEMTPWWFSVRLQYHLNHQSISNGDTAVLH